MITPDYDSIRWGPPSQLPYLGAGGANPAIEKYLAIDVGGAGSVNTVNLTLNQIMASYIVVTNAGSGATTIAWPGVMPGHSFIVLNGSGQDCIFKVTGGTGITVADTKKAILVGNTTDIVRVTADT